MPDAGREPSMACLFGRAYQRFAILPRLFVRAYGAARSEVRPPNGHILFAVGGNGLLHRLPPVETQSGQAVVTVSITPV